MVRCMCNQDVSQFYSVVHETIGSEYKTLVEKLPFKNFTVSHENVMIEVRFFHRNFFCMFRLDTLNYIFCSQWFWFLKTPYMYFISQGLQFAQVDSRMTKFRVRFQPIYIENCEISIYHRIYSQTRRIYSGQTHKLSPRF